MVNFTTLYLTRPTLLIAVSTLVTDNLLYVVHNPLNLFTYLLLQQLFLSL